MVSSIVHTHSSPLPPQDQNRLFVGHPAAEVNLILLWLSFPNCKQGQELTLLATPATGMTVPGEADILTALIRKFHYTFPSFLPSLIYLPAPPPPQRTGFILLLPWRTLWQHKGSGCPFLYMGERAKGIKGNTGSVFRPMGTCASGDPANPKKHCLKLLCRWNRDV